MLMKICIEGPEVTYVRKSTLLFILLLLLLLLLLLMCSVKNSKCHC